MGGVRGMGAHTCTLTPRPKTNRDLSLFFAKLSCNVQDKKKRARQASLSIGQHTVPRQPIQKLSTYVVNDCQLVQRGIRAFPIQRLIPFFLPAKARARRHTYAVAYVGDFHLDKESSRMSTSQTTSSSDRQTASPSQPYRSPEQLAH